jgi:hypothetical protein
MALSESEITTETVVIPGELRLSNPLPPPITVSLPIQAWPHGPKNVLLGLLAFPIGVLFGLMFVLLVLGAHNLGVSLLDAFIVLVVLPFSLLVGVTFLGLALTCFWDAVRSGPVLEVTSEGLRDYRSGLSVAWSSVRCAQLLYDSGGSASVDLQLRLPVTNWQNPFRIGVLTLLPKPDHVIVSAASLDARGHVLAYAILTLTEWNGGEAITKPPRTAGMGTKLIPRRQAARSVV